MPSKLYLEACAGYLENTYLPRLRRAAEALGDHLWDRPHPEVLTAGNVLLHLEGNVRQWILSGLLGAADHRKRASEFAAEGGLDLDTLWAPLEETVREAARGLRAMDPARLGETRRIQGFDQTILEAILHVVEHFSWHVGQVVHMAKTAGGPGHGIAFYSDARVNAARNEPESNA